MGVLYNRNAGMRTKQASKGRTCVVGDVGLCRCGVEPNVEVWDKYHIKLREVLPED